MLYVVTTILNTEFNVVIFCHLLPHSNGNKVISHCPRTVSTLYFIFAPDCPVDQTTIVVNPRSEQKWCMISNGAW